MKLIVADDHPLIRDALADALKCLHSDAEVFTAENGTQVLDLLDEHTDVQLLLLDLFMPGAEGFKLLSRICAAFPDLKVVVMSGSEDRRHMQKSLDAGASGYIPKSENRDLTLSAIQLVLAGGIYVPPAIVGQGPGLSSTLDRGDTTGQPGSHPARIEGLTVRQVEVLRLIGLGQSNKEIARALGLSENTVKIHVAAIFRALNVNNRTQAAVVARERGLLDETEPSMSGAP
ncbi:MAG: response regulator transcription factor [Pseudomonadota bacterium]